MKINSDGRSMVEMLGVLAIIGVLAVGGLVGFTKAMNTYKINKTADLITRLLANYSVSQTNNIRDLNIQGQNSVNLAKNMQLIDDCNVKRSSIDGYDVCEVPLGEVYIKFINENVSSSKDEYKIKSYMLFVSLLKDPYQSCIQLLSYQWQKDIPAEWWNTGLVWVTYDGSEYKVVDFNDRTTILSACGKMCQEINGQCSIVFDFVQKAS